MDNLLSVLCTTQVDENGDKHKVLVVDPDAKACEETCQTLDNYGLNAIKPDGFEGLVQAIEKTQPAAVVLEIDVDGIDGFDVCSELKASKATQSIPVVFLTNNTRPELMLCGFEVGAADYLRKGCESLELIARVRTHIQVTVLHKRLARNQSALARQLKQVNALMENERDLRAQVEQQQAQMLQAEKMASIGQLAAGVAHEINNPTGFVASNLSSLDGYLTDLKTAIEAYDMLFKRAQSSGQMPEEVESVAAVLNDVELDYVMGDIGDLIHESLDGTKRIRQIVADLRDFSHVDSPDLALEDINQLIDKTLNVAHNEIKYKADVKTQYGDTPEICCYGGKLGQVFLNLFVNAAHAIADRGQITVRTGAEGSRVWIEVEDDGSGIKPEHLTRIFDPFYTTKDVGKGTGLGLHLAYQTIQAHEGEITVRSQWGQGTVFRIELPVDGPDTHQAKGGADGLAA